MNSPTQLSTWIERGPDGRPYYVKRKPVLPSLRQKVAEAINEIRSRNPFFNGAQVNAPPSLTPQPTTQSKPVPDQNLPSRTSTSRSRPSSKHKPQAQPEMAERRKDPAQPSTTYQPQSLTQPQYFQWPQYYTPLQAYPPSSQPPPSTTSNVQNQQNAALQLAHYAAPHPRMYPYAPPGSQALTVPTTGGYHGHTNDIPNLSQPTFPHLPTAGPPGDAHPRLGQVAMPPVLTNHDDMKHKCSACGRNRSARYQWKHRIMSGQSPKPSICRKCRKQATDSEDESTDSYEEKDHRSQARSRRHSRGRTSRPQSKARSASRSAHRKFDFDYYAFAQPETSSTETDESDQTRPRHRQSRVRRGRSPSVEIVRYVQESRPQSRKKKIVYVEDRCDQQELSDTADQVEYRYLSDAPRPQNLHSRPGTPATRLLPRRYPGSESHPPIIVERREYYDGPPTNRRLRHVSTSRSDAHHAYQQARSVSRQPTYSYEQHQDTDDELFYDLGKSVPRGRIKGSGRSRSRSRVSIDEGAESGLLDHHVLAAPDTPVGHRRRSSSLGYVDATRDERPEKTTRDHDEHPRSSSRRRRRLHTDEVKVSEELPPADDYDWYDKDGMKVRVREI